MEKEYTPGLSVIIHEHDGSTLTIDADSLGIVVFDVCTAIYGGDNPTDDEYAQMMHEFIVWVRRMRAEYTPKIDTPDAEPAP